MPRTQDIIGRHAQPRAATARASSFGMVAGGAGRATTGRALYSGAWYYDGTATYGDGGRAKYDGLSHYGDGCVYHEPE